jgi:hypothetical protein
VPYVPSKKNWDYFFKKKWDYLKIQHYLKTNRALCSAFSAFKKNLGLFKKKISALGSDLSAFRVL